MTGSLADRILRGETGAVARGLRAIEDGSPERSALLAAIAPRVGRAQRVGVTGAPGVGKSSLVAALVREARGSGRRVAVLAVDPSSPYSGGALLGDRIRMAEHALDPGVFVRSMASRGALGGLARASGESMDLLDAAGYDLVLVETAGAGQTDVAVMHEADQVLVVLAPGAGDQVQAMKSGILEIAALWVVNKASDPRAEQVRDQLLAALELGDRPVAADAVLLTDAVEGRGVAALLAALDQRHRGVDGGESGRQRARLAARLGQALCEEVAAWSRRESPRREACLDRVAAGQVTVDEAAVALLAAGFSAPESAP